MDYLAAIQNDFHVCRLCGATVQHRVLRPQGYEWICKCGCAQRVWTCSKEYQEALEQVLAA